MFYYSLTQCHTMPKPVFLLILLSNLLLFSIPTLQAESTLHVFESSTISPQDTLPKQRREHPSGIHLVLGGPTIITSLSIDYYVSPELKAEIGAGLLGAYGGMTLHLFHIQDEKRWSPYAGAYFIYFPVDVGEALATGSYLPIGIQYRSKKGFTMSFEIAFIFSDDPINNLPYFAGLKVGHRFLYE